jgi:excisionase family DNA binding protein
MILFDDAVLRPLIERVVVAVLDRLECDRAKVGERMAFSEAEAAALLGVQRHVLRDARLRGELSGCRIGKGIRYERDELLQFLRRRRGL